MGEKRPNRFNPEMFACLLRFAEAEPQTPAAFRPHLQQMAQYFINCRRQRAEADFTETGKTEAGNKQGKAATGAQPAFYAGDSVFSALLSGNFLCRRSGRGLKSVEEM